MWAAKTRPSRVTAAMAHLVTVVVVITGEIVATGVAIIVTEIVVRVVAIVTEIVVMVVAIVTEIVAMGVAEMGMAAMAVITTIAVVAKFQRQCKRAAMPFQQHQHKRAQLRLHSRNSSRQTVPLTVCSVSTYFPSTKLIIQTSR